MNSICSFSKLKNFNILLVDNINTISAISGTYTLNQSDYAIGGENVYFISNSTTPSSTGDASTNQSGTFTINVASATKIIYYMIFAGGGGGGCGSNWRWRRRCLIHKLIINIYPWSRRIWTTRRKFDIDYKRYYLYCKRRLSWWSFWK
jgi:hypothetical protein